MIFFSEYAFAKLSWFRTNCNDNNVSNLNNAKPSFLEVSLMGVSKSLEEINYIVDFVCIPQEASSGLTEPTDEGMLEYSENMLIDKNIPSVMFRSFWAHTHPGTSPTPSGTDNETFAKWFKDSDIGVMYILAENDDSCMVKNQSKYFGRKNENMDTYVVFNREDNNGNAIWLSTKTLFAINKLGVTDGYDGVSSVMADDYTEFHPAWMEELKKNVKKKSWAQSQTTPVGGYSHYGDEIYTQYRGTYTKQEEKQEDKQEKQETKTEHRAIGYQTKPKTYGIKAEELIELLIRYKKENINMFTLADRKTICAACNITLGDLQELYNRIKLFEENFQLENLMPWEKDVLTLDGKSNFHALDQKKITEICKDLLIRPICLESVIKRYIDKAFAPFGI